MRATSSQGTAFGLVLAAVVAGVGTGACAGPPPGSGTGAGDVHDGAVGPSGPPIVILVIGDGMGRGQREVASRFQHGVPGQLAMEQLPVHAEIATGSLSGVTDSGAAATTLASGVFTTNANVGLDRADARVETLIELAHRHGLPAGVVTTALLPHATPAGFAAHRTSRHDYNDIADDEVRITRPEVMLGGGARYFRPMGPASARQDAGLLAELAIDGYDVVETEAALVAAVPTADKVFGVFADEHLDYVLDRPTDSTQPTLREMTLAALDVLDRPGTGFFLMVEGARIDMASHDNDVERGIQETLAMDRTVDAIATWAAGRPEVTLIVTADHECGGLAVTTPAGTGELPTVSWRWGSHTNARIDAFAQGPGTGLLAGGVRDHAWVHEVAAARLESRVPVAPRRTLVPDGRLDDLRHEASTQTLASGFDPMLNRLDALRVDVDRSGLALGIEGRFEWGENAVVVLIDVDLGDGTGPAGVRGALTDRTGVADTLLSSLGLDAPAVDGFGADLALVIPGGADPHLEDLVDGAGLRGLRPPYGAAGELTWLPAAVNFGEGVRLGAPPALTPVEGEGLEAHIPWRVLYPALSGRVPADATLGIAVVLVSSDGGFTSNQALPPFPAGTANPGDAPASLPGVVRFRVDADADGLPDGDTAPTVVR